MFSGLSGLRNQQMALDVVGNNIANVNTVGFKTSRIQFAELLSQTIRGASSPQADGMGGTNPIQVGLGIATSAIEVSHQQGNLQSTGNMSDLAIQGNGFFVLSDGSSQSYTRAGAFSFDSKGTLVSSDGRAVQGWQADSTGVIDKNASLGNMTIPIGQTINANATTEIQYAHNLDSRSNQLGAPILAEGNSANVERVYGKYTGDTTASADQATAGDGSLPITDMVGSHLISIYAETHIGSNGALNGTETLSSLGITVADLSNFRVNIDGSANRLNLTSGLNTTVNDLISAINSQIKGVTAELSANNVKLTRTVAGESATVSVEDTDYSVTGIAAKIFGGNLYGAWASHAETTGIKTGIAATDTLATYTAGGMNLSRDLRVTLGTNTYDYNANTRGLTGATTVSGMIDDFNAWATGVPINVFMGLDKSGQIFVAHKTSDTSGAVKVDDFGGASGIADKLFATTGDWGTEGVAAFGGKHSSAAYVTDQFQEADGGGTHYSAVGFASGDNTLDGLPGVTIMASSSGFKTGSIVINTVDPTQHVVSTQVFDSLGNAHNVSLTLTRTSDNNWDWAASGVGVSGAGTLTFDSNGKLQSGATSGTIAVAASGGSNSLTVTPDFSNITQYADQSTMVHVEQDGYANGSLSTFSIDASGEVLGIYTNGLNQKIGQIAVAAFNNPGGLIKVADTMFVSSNNSGEPQVGQPNTGGRGALSAGTLEMSNVDVAQEFANMIIYERGFQANSKMITTGDELLNTLVSMKR